MAFPVDNTKFDLTGRYGPRNQFRLPNGKMTAAFHGGDDLAPEAKGTHEIAYATRAGKVHSVGRKVDAGIFVILEYPNGDRVRYCHLSSYSVRAGQDVYDGQPIGRVGNTGNSTGVHLHFELYPGGNLNVRADPRNHYWWEPNPATMQQPKAPVAPAPAPAPIPRPPARKTARVNGTVRLATNWHAYKYNTLQHKIGMLPPGDYKIRGIVNGHLKLQGKGGTGWVHRSAAAGVL